jgi:hypothetical protein
VWLLQLGEFRAAVWIPHLLHNIMFRELYRIGMPLFVPALPLLASMSRPNSPAMNTAVGLLHAGALRLRTLSALGGLAFSTDWTVEYQLLHAQHSWANIPQEEDPPADAPVAPADLDNHTSVLYVLEHLAEYYNWP